MQRKEFIIQCGKMCFVGLVAAPLLASCNANYYAVSTLSSNQLVLKKSEFIEHLNGKNKFRKYVLLKTEKLTYPICIYRLNDKSYSALYLECSHNHCELNPSGDYLVCPCHGSEFNNLGKVQNPPAETDLQRFKILQDDENLYIQL